MTMLDRQQLKNEIIRRLSAAPVDLPVSTLGRLRRTATTALRGGSVALGRAIRKDSTDALPTDALFKIVSPIAALKGVAMKMGQILGSVDSGLPDEVRTALSVLQTHAQPMPFSDVRTVVQRDLGASARDLLKQMDPRPIAMASIGQVHRAELPDGTAVAVKVRYPAIDKAIALDFGPAAAGGKLVTFFLPNARLDSFVREARERFLEECDYVREARTHQLFYDLFAGHPMIVIPELHADYCTPRVLTSTLIDGVHLDEFLASNPDPSDRDWVGTALFEFYIGSLFRHGIYNCDPHPGNYLFCPDGRVAMLDFGCAREFDLDFISRLAALTRAVHVDSREQLHLALIDLGIVRDGEHYDFHTARRMVRSFYGPMLLDDTQAFEPGVGMSMREITGNKKDLLKLALPGEFLFLLRVRFGLASVLARLKTRANWYQLERQFLDEHDANVAAENEALDETDSKTAAAASDRPATHRSTPPPPLPRKKLATGPSSFDVVLLASGDRAIQVIREVRAATGMGVREAKDLVDGGPQPVKQGMERKDAEALSRKLSAAGGRVEIRPTR